MSQPSLLTRINAVLLIGASMFVAGCLPWGFTIPSIFAWIGTIMGLVVILPLARRQYQAISRSDQASVTRLRNWIIGVICFLTLPLLMTVGIFFRHGAAPISVGIVFLGLPDLWLLYTLFLTVRWRRQLAREADVIAPDDASAIAEQSELRAPWRTKAAVVAVVGLLLGIWYGSDSNKPHRKVHVSAAEADLGLPAGASDVCIYVRYPHDSVYSFAIDEPGFRQWVESLRHPDQTQERYAIKPITGFYTIRAPADDAKTPDDSDAKPEPYADHQIQRGWYCDLTNDVGRGLSLAFDADEGRAYFEGHGG